MPRKLDWAFLNAKEQLRKIIKDNAVYISLPPLGSNSNVVTVIGQNNVYIERAIRAIMILVS